MTVEQAELNVIALDVLVLCDDVWHPASNIRSGLKPLEELGFSFTFIENSAQWTAEKMATYSVTILTKANHVSSTDERPWMTAETEKAIVKYVEDGAGLLVVHSGSALYQKSQLLLSLLGGSFISHPEQCPITVSPKPSHHLTAGSKEFIQTDEHYMMNMTDDDVSVFLTIQSEHGSQPAGWTRTQGRGRVCVLTPGHNLSVWLDPSYQKLVHNAIEWCSKQVR